MSILALSEIKKDYAASRHRIVHALNDVTLNLDAGRSYAITGPSGSGKSTLLSILGMLLSPTSGQYVFDGVDVSRLREREKCRLRNGKIGIVVQDFALVEGSTALDNTLLPALIAGTRNGQAKRRALAIMEEVGIAELCQTKVINLSGGQRQRVAICRALMNTPVLILADEPTGALDHNTGQHIVNTLLALTEKGVTVVIATHNAAYATQCNTTISLQDGRLLDE